MKKRILIIENDNAIREILSWFLQDEGYEVTGTGTGSPASFTSYKADLILLNEWASKAQGHKLCEDIEQIRQLQRIPVIVLSTSPFIDKIAEGCNADDFIAMPFNLEEVISKVEKCFSADWKRRYVLND